MAAKLNIGFLGAGKMATALAKGFVRAEIVLPREIIGGDPHEAARKNFADELGSKVTASNREVARFATVLVLATKPDQAPAALAEIREEVVSNGHLLISIAAGVTIGRLEGALAPGARVIRVMPNTPALVGAGASAFALGKNATRGRWRRCREIVVSGRRGLSGEGKFAGRRHGLKRQRTGVCLSVHRGA